MNSGKSQKVLFVHDGPLYKDQSGHFYGLHYNNKLIARYTLLGSEVRFLIRMSKLPVEKGQFSRIDHPAFSAIEFPDLKTLSNRFFNKKQAKEVTRQAVLESDVIVARLPSSSGSLAVEYALKYKKPLMVEFVACGWDSYWNYNWKGKLVAPYFFVRQRVRMLKVPYVIYVTKSFLQGRYPSKGKTASISDVELPEISTEVLKKRIERISSRQDTKPLVLGTVAALDVPYKGQEDVIRAIHQLKQKGIYMNYQLVGQGNPQVLNKLICTLGLENEVSILGALTHQQVFDFLDQIDIYIQPSKQEGLPRAVIEAMSRGCLLMGSTAGGIPELIAPQFIFKSGSPAAIRIALEQLDQAAFVKSAYDNYAGAASYSKTRLEAERSAFYAEFLEDHQLINALTA